MCVSMQEEGVQETISEYVALFIAYNIIGVDSEPLSFFPSLSITFFTNTAQISVQGVCNYFRISWLFMVNYSET